LDRSLGEPRVGLDDVGGRKPIAFAMNRTPISLPPGQELISIPTEPKCMESIKFIRRFTCCSWAEELIGSFTARYRP
jgi:hypothetical protein